MKFATGFYSRADRRKAPALDCGERLSRPAFLWSHITRPVRKRKTRNPSGR
jgi:hypothetical protein